MSIGKAVLAAAAAAVLISSTAAMSAGTAITVYKTPWCGCCGEWIKAVENAHYRVETVDLEDLAPVKDKVGVPADMESCHVATVEGYFLEGHVPLEAIARLLSERPDIAGLAVPGMPEGALGMGDGLPARYDVYAIPRAPDAEPSIFDRVGG